VAPQREWLDVDYYKVLGIAESATDKEITRAYRKLAKSHHPDSGGDEERFKEISAAYDVLGDAEKRKEYDQLRKMGPAAGLFNGQGADFDFDIGDVFGGLFNRMRGGGRANGASARGAGPQRGRDLEAELHLDFEDAVRGLTTTIHLSGDAALLSALQRAGFRPVDWGIEGLRLYELPAYLPYARAYPATALTVGGSAQEALETLAALEPRGIGLVAGPDGGLSACTPQDLQGYTYVLAEGRAGACPAWALSAPVSASVTTTALPSTFVSNVCGLLRLNTTRVRLPACTNCRLRNAGSSTARWLLGSALAVSMKSSAIRGGLAMANPAGGLAGGAFSVKRTTV
jgi:hypothetical protein